MITDDKIHFPLSPDLPPEPAKQKTQNTKQNTDYYELKHISDEDVAALADADPETFKAPAIFLVDFTTGPHNQGISEVMFGVSGDSDLDKATLLSHCWNHTDEFSIDNKTL